MSDDDHLPDVAVQAIPVTQDQEEIALNSAKIKFAPTNMQSVSDSQDSYEDQGLVPEQGDVQALPQPCQIDEELVGECSRGRRNTTGHVRGFSSTYLNLEKTLLIP